MAFLFQCCFAPTPPADPHEQIALVCHAAAAGDVKTVLAHKHDWAHLLSDDSGSPVHYAVTANQLQVVAAMAEHVKSLPPAENPFNLADKQGLTPLHWAVMIAAVNPALLKALLDGNADWRIPVPTDQRNLLHLAIAKGDDAETLKCAIAVLGREPAATLSAQPDAAGFTPVHAAIVRVDAPGEYVKVLAPVVQWTVVPGKQDAYLFFCIEKLAPASLAAVVAADPVAAHLRNAAGSHALHVIADVRDPASATALTNAYVQAVGGWTKIDLGMPDPARQLRSVPHIATAAQDTPLVDLLAQHVLESPCRTAFQVADTDGNTPLHTAAAFNSLSLVKLVAPHSISAANKNGDHPIHLAATNGFLPAATFLAEQFPDQINAANGSGWTPLHLACHGGHVSLIPPLARHGGHLASTDRDGNTPLHLAISARSRAPDVVHYLLEAGADANARNTWHQTPLHLAVAVAEHDTSVQLVALLLHAAKIDPAAKDRDGNTPLHVAVTHRHMVAVRFLLDHVPASTAETVENAAGLVPVHVAVREAAVELVPVLAKGINHVSTVSGKTALDYALEGGNAAVIEAVRTAGGLVAADVPPPPVSLVHTDKPSSKRLLAPRVDENENETMAQYLKATSADGDGDDEDPMAKYMSTAKGKTASDDEDPMAKYMGAQGDQAARPAAAQVDDPNARYMGKSSGNDDEDPIAKYMGVPVEKPAEPAETGAAALTADDDDDPIARYMGVPAEKAVESSTTASASKDDDDPIARYMGMGVPTEKPVEKPRQAPAVDEDNDPIARYMGVLSSQKNEEPSQNHVAGRDTNTGVAAPSNGDSSAHIPQEPATKHVLDAQLSNTVVPDTSSSVDHQCLDKNENVNSSEQALAARSALPGSMPLLAASRDLILDAPTTDEPASPSKPAAAAEPAAAPPTTDTKPSQVTDAAPAPAQNPGHLIDPVVSEPQPLTTSAGSSVHTSADLAGQTHLPGSTMQLLANGDEGEVEAAMCATPLPASESQIAATNVTVVTTGLPDEAGGKPSLDSALAPSPHQEAAGPEVGVEPSTDLPTRTDQAPSTAVPEPTTNLAPDTTVAMPEQTQEPVLEPTQAPTPGKAVPELAPGATAAIKSPVPPADAPSPTPAPDHDLLPDLNGDTVDPDPDALSVSFDLDKSSSSAPPRMSTSAVAAPDDATQLRSVTGSDAHLASADALADPEAASETDLRQLAEEFGVTEFFEEDDKTSRIASPDALGESASASSEPPRDTVDVEVDTDAVVDPELAAMEARLRALEVEQAQLMDGISGELDGEVLDLLAAGSHEDEVVGSVADLEASESVGDVVARLAMEERMLLDALEQGDVDLEHAPTRA
ncbi:B-cell lymphoma 3 protein [Allomyces arbusculus]|nr:B-cell lymphoma 3 protein [Allomyces arbusculus]